MSLISNLDKALLESYKIQIDKALNENLNVKKIAINDVNNSIHHFPDTNPLRLTPFYDIYVAQYIGFKQH